MADTPDTPTPRDPHPDNDLIDTMIEEGAPSHGNMSGNRLAHVLAARDELKTAGGGDPEPTQANKSDYPNDGAKAKPGLRDGTKLA